MERLTDNYSHWNKLNMTRVLAEESQGMGLDATDVRELVEAKIAGRELVNIGEVVTDRRNDSANSWRERTEERFTTQEILDLEAELLSAVESLGRKPAGVDPHVARGVIELTREKLALEGKTLSGEQAKAIEELTTRDGGVSCLIGVAGSSKSTILGSCRLAWELSGKQVIGCALAGVAQDSLKESSGIESDTLAMTLMRLRHGRLTLTPDTVAGAR